MRRIVVGVVLVLLAGILAPPSIGAQETTSSPVSAPTLAPTPIPAAAPTVGEPELSRGGFIDFGARMTRRPNNRFSCGSSGFNTCSLESINFVTGEAHAVPAGRGRITQLRIRVGNVTGPMRVDVVQTLRHVSNPGVLICCTLVRRSPILRPNRNSISTFNVNLPVFTSRGPVNGFYVGQRLELTVLSRNVPIPASINNNSTFTGWYPGWSRVGQQRVNPLGGRGFMILLRARWRPT